MKTFLHYTKQKELDEGFMSALGGVASGVVRGAMRVGRGVSNVASALSSERAQSIGAMLGGKTGKVTDAIKAFSGSTDSAKHEMDTDAEHINLIHKRLPNRRNHPDVQTHEDNLLKISASNRGNPKKANEQKRKYLKNYAEQLRKDKTNTVPPTL